MTLLGHFELLISILVGAVEIFKILIYRDTALNPSSGNLWWYFVFLLFFPSAFKRRKAFTDHVVSPLTGSRATTYIRKCGRANCDARRCQGARLKPRGLRPARPPPPARGAALPAPTGPPAQLGPERAPRARAAPLRPLPSRLLASPAAWKSPPGKHTRVSPARGRGPRKVPKLPAEGRTVRPRTLAEAELRCPAQPWCPAHGAVRGQSRARGKGGVVPAPSGVACVRHSPPGAPGRAGPEFPGRGAAGGAGSAPPAPCQAPHIGWALLGPAVGACSEPFCSDTKI